MRQTAGSKSEQVLQPLKEKPPFSLPGPQGSFFLAQLRNNGCGPVIQPHEVMMTEQIKPKHQDSKVLPPPNAISLDSWDDAEKAPKAQVAILRSPTGDQRQTVLKDGNLRILKTLAKAPLYCASRVRISDRVLILKRDHGVNIRTDMYRAPEGSDCDRFGVYTLLDDVTFEDVGGAK